MFELFWAVWTIPKVIYPVAAANGKSGLKWTFYSIILFLMIEISILALYFCVYFAVSEGYGLPNHPEHFWLTYVIYVSALLIGLSSVDFVRRFLSKEKIYKPI